MLVPAAVLTLAFFAFPAEGSDPGAPTSATSSVSPPGDSAERNIEQGDALYARRAEGRAGTRASPREIGEAIEAYTRAARDASSAAARWRLARALYFLGTYTGLDEAGRRNAFARARDEGEAAVRIVLRRNGSAAGPRDLEPPVAAALVRADPDAPAAYFWTAVGWGQWALTSAKLDAIRHGAAVRVRDAAETVTRISPAFEEGGGYRIVGRLHDQAPKIPLLTGWISRDEALRALRLAVREAPANLVNLHFLAEALARRGEAGEAVRIETDVAAAEPSPGHLVEELVIQETARRNLALWKAAAP